MTRANRDSDTKRAIPFLIAARAIFLIMAFQLGYNYRYHIDPFSLESDALISAFTFLLVAGILVYIETQIEDAFPQELMIGLFGLVVGLTIATIISATVILDSTTQGARIMRIGLHFILGYLGTVLGLRHAERFDFSLASFLVPGKNRLRGAQILDTSVLIDGRIVEVGKSGILVGPVVVPRFVLDELQALADSNDHRKRTKGRRGFDILSKLRESESIDFEILEQDFDWLDGVDQKLLAMVRLHDGRLCTMDYNLARLAELQQATVVDLNRLALAIKRSIISGEEVEVEILREGKEEDQGVGYLDDGTMVVIDKGREWIGERVRAVVTSVLQTAAGQMVFARRTDVLIETAQVAEESSEKSSPEAVKTS